MEATIVPDVQKHYPVLLKEIISVITPQHGGTFIDCTFGQGGYSKKILEFENTKVIGLDRDIETQKVANSILENFGDRFIFKNLKFSQLTNLKIKNENIKGVIFDLGYSLTQMKDPKKGLSFNSMTDLNMQLGLNNYSAADAINKLDAKELEKIFKYFGDEKDAKYISKNIVKERLNKKIDTQGLIKIVDKSKNKVLRLISEEKFNGSDIAILSDLSMKPANYNSKNSLRANLEENDLEVISAREYAMPYIREGYENKITFDSIKRFKGLEKPIILLVNLDNNLDNEDKMRDIYSGLSRARGHLIIVSNQQSINYLKDLYSN